MTKAVGTTRQMERRGAAAGDGFEANLLRIQALLPLFLPGEIRGLARFLEHELRKRRAAEIRRPVSRSYR